MLVTNLTLTPLMMQIDGKKLGLDTLLGFEKLLCVAHSFEICRQHESVRFVLAFFLFASLLGGASPFICRRATFQQFLRDGGQFLRRFFQKRSLHSLKTS